MTDPSTPAPDDGLGAPHRAPPVFYRNLREFLRSIPGARQRFWVLVLAVGALAGLGAGALLSLLALVQRFAWPPAGTFVEAVAAAGTVRRLAVPVGAGVVVSIAFLVWRRLEGGHGTARILEAIWNPGRELSLGRTLSRALLSIVSVGAGASLGREGALVQTGAAAGSWLAARLRIGEAQARVLVACGAAAGIAAAYDVPIGGALFGLEVLLGSFALELLGPIVVSCVVAVVVARTLPVPHLAYAVPPYELLRPSSIALGLALAPVLGLASAFYVRVMGWVEVTLDRLPAWFQPVLPPLGMLAVGLLALRWPQIPGNGFDTVRAMANGLLPLGLLLVLPLLKLAATAACAGTGVPGGLFTPSLFYGAAIGGAVGQLAEHVWPGLAAPGALALVGMAGVLAGTTHAAVSSALIVYEMTGDYGVILPLMICAAVAAIVSRAVEPDSLYTAPLRRRGVRLPALPRPEWLRSTEVSALVRHDAETVPPDAPFEDVLRRLMALPPGHDLYVTGAGGGLVGIIRLDALEGTFPDQAHPGKLVAGDLANRAAEWITTGTSLEEVARRFREGELERLPVVDDAGRLLGTVGMRDLIAAGRFGAY